MFRRRDGREWLNLALAALASLYILYAAWAFVTRGLFEYIGIDYRAILASAQIAFNHGFSHVYDLSLQSSYQKPLFNLLRLGAIRPAFDPVPLPYLPFFIATFLPTIALAPIPGFVIFVIVQGVGLALYLRWYSMKVGPGSTSYVVFLLGLPAFLTLLFGQVNLWLLICLGQAILTESQGRDAWAGMWLAGLLLKPQVLILLIPALIMTRRLRILEGFSIGAVFVMGLSILLAGSEGLVRLAELILSYPNNLPTTYPESMMNFRALALLLGMRIPGGIATGIAVLGIIMTTILAAMPWRKVVLHPGAGFATALLGTYAATCAITWHAHVHMALPLLAPLMFLLGRTDFPVKLLFAWILIPGLVFTAVAFSLGPGTAHQAAGMVMLAANLMLVVWCARATQSTTRLSRVLDLRPS